jgi:hypothetical protein
VIAGEIVQIVSEIDKNVDSNVVKNESVHQQKKTL